MAAPRNISDLPRTEANERLIARDRAATEAWRAGRNLNPLRQLPAANAPAAPNRGIHPGAPVGAGRAQPATQSA